MDIAGAILIAVGIIIGGVMSRYGLQKKHIPKGLTISHGIFVVLGLICLLIYAFTTSGHHKHWESIIIFTVAAMGGIYLLDQDLRKHKFPIWVLAVHAVIGLGGLIWLTIHLFH